MYEDQICPLEDHTLAVLRAANEMDSTLLITGSSGTGKSHLAYGIHSSHPKRSTQRWYKINLATLSENLIESELFGHERGAFTGADQKRIGRLESCNGGTIFLDEIGELSLRLQAKLLDFIQYKKICPVGSNREIELDVRIIAATNKDLDHGVASGEFRRDLFHRLNVFHIKLPELVQRRGFIIALARHFLLKRSSRMLKPLLGFQSKVEVLFENYPWPGNIRELENVIEYAIAMETGREVQLSSLPPQLQKYAIENTDLPEKISEEPEPLPRLNEDTLGYLELPIWLEYHKAKDSFEKAYLERILRHYGGQINLTSRETGLNKVSLAEKIRKHQIDWKSLKTG